MCCAGACLCTCKSESIFGCGSLKVDIGGEASVKIPLGAAPDGPVADWNKIVGLANLMKGGLTAAQKVQGAMVIKARAEAAISLIEEAAKTACAAKTLSLCPSSPPEF